MAFDPFLPVNNSEITASELRSQFNGLFDLIQTIPVGPAGPAGVNAAVIDGVTTGNAGESAAAAVSLAGETLHFTFSIPRGDLGATGATGATGADGGTGPVGPTGPPFTSFVIDGVTTLDPALPATVTAVFDGTNVKLAFGLPRGEQGQQGERGTAGDTGPTGPAFTNFLIDSVTTLDPALPATVTLTVEPGAAKFAFGIPRGLQGNDGATGPTGPTGSPGAPGEVSQTQLDNAVAGTSSNSNGVAIVAGPYADPDAEELRLKLNELLLALRR